MGSCCSTQPRTEKSTSAVPPRKKPGMKAEKSPSRQSKSTRTPSAGSGGLIPASSESRKVSQTTVIRPIEESGRSYVLIPDSTPPNTIYYDQPSPQERYEPRHITDTVTALEGLANCCNVLAHSLQSLVTLSSFLGVLDGKPVNGTSMLDGDIPWPVKEYSQAFNFSERSRTLVLAALFAKWAWECIDNYSIFTPEAAIDLKHVERLPNFAPTDTEGIQEEGYYATRLVKIHGAGRGVGCVPGTPQYAHVQKHFVQPLKNTFSGSPTAKIELLFDRFGADVWHYGMLLKNQKGQIYATFHPGQQRSEYARRQRGVSVAQLLYYNPERRRHYLPKEMGPVEGFPKVPKPVPGVVVWFPEVTLLTPKDRLKDGTMNGVVFQAKYSQPP